MRNTPLVLVLALLAAAVLGTDYSILTFPLFVWKEPAAVLWHACAVAALCVVLRARAGLFAAAMGALLFGVFPGHAYAWAVNAGVWGAVLYILVLAAVLPAAVGIARFRTFLATQERLVQHLFTAALIVLAASFTIMSIQINSAWRTEETLWRWRVAHGGGVSAINRLITVLGRGDYPADPRLNRELQALYERSLTENPDQPDLLNRFAEYQLTMGKTSKAIDLYTRALKLAPRHAETYFYLASLYDRLNNPQAMIELFNALLKEYPEDDRICLRIIKAYSRAIQNHPQDAIYQEKREELLAQYEQLSKRKKYTADDFFNLGLLYEQVGGFEEAMRFYHKALELNPSHEKSLLNLASRYQAAGDPKAALGLYERYIHFYPKSTVGYLKTGILFNALGDADKARSFYQRVIHIDDNNADAYFYLGYLSETAGELREALGNYEKAVENNPQYAEAYYNMGNVYAAMAQYPEAIASYLKTVAIDPAHQNAFVNLSILSFKSGDFQGAIRYLDKAKRLGYVAPEGYLKTLEPYRKP